MVRRLGFLLLLLAVLATPVAASPVSDVEGVKASSESSSHASDAPATTVWGMLVTILLVMGASTATLLGGGLRNAVMAQRSAEPAVSRPAAAPAETKGEPETARKIRKSPKNKSKRAFSHRQASQERARAGRGAARRGVQAAKPRRRGGPGCRGVR